MLVVGTKLDWSLYFFRLLPPKHRKDVALEKGRLISEKHVPARNARQRRPSLWKRKKNSPFPEVPNWSFE